MNTSSDFCKNCKKSLTPNSSFCSNCGAKVVSRITLKSMFSEFAENVLGWDNKFFVTLKLMVLGPHLLLSEYIEGVRKKYIHPFSYIVIGITSVLFALNFFLDDYIESSNSLNVEMIEWAAENIGGPYSDSEFQKAQLEGSKESQEFVLKYFNILTLAFIPIYTFVAFIIYRKPYNYGEHLVINAYIQGTTFVATFVIFLISVLINPIIYYIITPITVFYYLYVYGKLYKLTFAESLLKLLLFIAAVIALTIIGSILLFVVGYLSARLGYNIFEK